MSVGAYPGSFDPPTVAHVAVAEAAVAEGGPERVDFLVSVEPLGKATPAADELDGRLAVLRAVTATRPWLGVRRTEHRLLADIAAGYDALVVGADKWGQLLDPSWYGGSTEERDRCLSRLPRVLVVPRPPFPSPPGDDPRWTTLWIDPGHGEVSSTAVRAGRVEWSLPEASGPLGAPGIGRGGD